MNTPRRIGILGGMGPAATILLQRRLLGAVSARDDRDHIPLVIDMNPQVPSRIEHLVHGRGADPGPVLARMARGLERAGARALAMPCNTAHHYAGEIGAAVSVPFLNMVELSVERAARALAPGAAVGMLASPAVRLTGLFDRALERHGLRAAWPDGAHDLLGAIRSIKAGGDLAQARAILGEASAALAGAGAEMQLVACSEFSLIADATAPGARVLDTLDVLVGAIRAFAIPGDAQQRG